MVKEGSWEEEIEEKKKKAAMGRLNAFRGSGHACSPGVQDTSGAELDIQEMGKGPHILDQGQAALCPGSAG